MKAVARLSYGTIATYGKARRVSTVRRTAFGQVTSCRFLVLHFPLPGERCGLARGGRNMGADEQHGFRQWLICSCMSV